MIFSDSKERFSSRVADYVRYRPGYPLGILEILRAECGLAAEHAIADVGSGTGLLAEIFLKNGNHVFGVEPNKEMREAGEEYLANYPKFASVTGSAEATTLPAACVEFVSAGQAFHWFEPQATRAEFARILKPAGWVAVVWNLRTTPKTPFSSAYDNLLVRYGTDYTRVKEAHPGASDMKRFFGIRDYRKRELANRQVFDFEGLSGRLRSSSYAPREGDANYEPMMKELRTIFETHQTLGRVNMDYTTQMFIGQLDGDAA
ncbi:MAG TPA: class I SAM-dependent methyltransferase [Terriglobales bacterium]|nr:class I SAM-dependent methyltransferase [Terriglobales bacterium]HUL17395.1 class I SAM-dependent methyltransferase [Terriglobales bacterium]